MRQYEKRTLDASGRTSARHCRCVQDQRRRPVRMSRGSSKIAPSSLASISSSITFGSTELDVAGRERPLPVPFIDTPGFSRKIALDDHSGLHRRRVRPESRWKHMRASGVATTVVGNRARARSPGRAARPAETLPSRCLSLPTMRSIRRHPGGDRDHLSLGPISGAHFNPVGHHRVRIAPGRFRRVEAVALPGQPR